MEYKNSFIFVFEIKHKFYLHFIGLNCIIVTAENFSRYYTAQNLIRTVSQKTKKNLTRSKRKETKI